MSTQPFGAGSKHFAELAKIQGSPRLTYGVVGGAAEALHSTADTWAQQHMELSRLRSLGDAEFAQQKVDLLAALHEHVRTYMNTTNFTVAIETAKAYESRYPGASHTLVMKLAEQMRQTGK